jgi:hypothetical protein
MSLGKRIIRKTFNRIARSFAFVARKEPLAPVSRLLGQSTAQMVVHSKRLQRADNLQQLGETWQRAFPSKKLVPIESVSDNTVFAQIHDQCALRGSGDVHACYRMMEFDRGVLERIGGQFVVLESQATPGVTRCRVAMRMAGQDMQDLTPAHLADSPAQRVKK